jgi:hypothetical protein
VRSLFLSRGSSVVAEFEGNLAAVGQDWQRHVHASTEKTKERSAAGADPPEQFAESKVPLKMAVEKEGGMRGWVPVYESTRKLKHPRKGGVDQTPPACVGAVLIRCHSLSDDQDPLPAAAVIAAPGVAAVGAAAAAAAGSAW